MIKFYSTLEEEDDEKKAQQEIKVETLKTTNGFNKLFLDFICKL